MFSLRIVSTSHYQAEPLADLDVLYSSFRSADVRKVPVLRIFGATPAGQKTCMHVHGVFPYLYVPHDGSQPADGYMRRFAASLDKAINVANNSQANTQHVFKISLVAGIPMYGYHAEEQQFLKIYLYNPSTVRKAADLLLGGAVMNKSFQPHEAHIPFPLQLFIDYNLYGMNMINVAAVKFRRKQDHTDGKQPRRSRSPGRQAGSGDTSMEGASIRSPLSSRNTPASSNSSATNTPSAAYWDMENIPSDLLLPASVERQSVCELEVDVVAADILNRREVTDNMGKNPGLAALWEDERQRHRDAGQPSQITPQQSQEHEHVEASVSERELLERFAEILQEQQALTRSNSEESEMSVEESTLSPEEVTCIPASQLEDHSQPTSSQGDSQESQQSSQGTVVLEEGEEEEEGAIISLESIQRVVSFSQSFSRPGSQPSSTPTEGEVADQSLVDVLAALAEESSPSASQRCAAQVEALEDRDSVVGQGVAVPPDWDALQEDLEETLHMSQTLPEDRYDVEGLEATWDGSPKLKDHSPVDSDEAEKDDDDDDDDDNIPQLDGASDQKSGSKKSGKKRLGVRGPVLSTTHAAGARQRRGSSQGGDEDVPKGQSPPLSSPSAVHNPLTHSCDHSSKSHAHNTPSSSCSPQPSLAIADDAGDDDTDGAPLSFIAKALKESSQGRDMSSGQRQTADSCHPLSSVYSCAVSLQPLTASDSTGSNVKKNSPKMEDSDDSSDDNVPLIQIERQQKQGASLLPSSSASPKERTFSLSAEEQVSVEVCERLSESHHQQESHGNHSGGSTSNSNECVVRMKRVDTWNHSKKLALSLNKLRRHSPDHETSSPSSAHSPPSSPHYFTIPLPTPVYKRLKMRGLLSDKHQEVQCVRMYPTDASENDLQKIGCEILSVNRLTQEDLNPTDIGVGRSVDEGGSVAEEEALTRQFDDSKISESSEVTSPPVQGVDKGRWAKPRRLMGPKCKRKAATTSRIGHSATDPETVGICDKPETSGDGIHMTVPTSSESRAAPVHSSSTSVTCTTAAVTMASDDGRNAVGQQPLVSDCRSSVKGDSPCHKHPICKCQSVTSDGHVEDCSTPSHCASSSSAVGACKCEQLPSNNSCSCMSPWFPSLPLPVSVASPSSVSASVPVPLSSCRKDCGGSLASCQSHSALCHGDDMGQRGSKVSTKDMRAGSPHSASTCMSMAFQSGHASCSSASVSVMSVSSAPVALHSFHSSPIATTGACGLQETSAATPVSSVHSPGMLHQSKRSPASQAVSECCSCGGSTSQTVRCLQCSGDHKSSPVLHQGSPKNPPVSASDVPCTGTSSVSREEHQNSSDSTCLTQQSSLHGNSTLPDILDDNKTAAENDDMHEKAESESENLSQNSDLLVNSNSESNFCDKSQERWTGRRNSASFDPSKMSIEVDGEFLPFVPPMRHSSVQLWSLGDSDSETEDSEDSSDEYCPTARAQKKKRKRKGSKQQAKRTKWSSMNNGSHSNSRCVGQDREKKHGRKGQHGKAAKTKGKEKTEQLIEGVHYIVVGKFKGHRIMLVKLERVKVDENERVKVSEWQGKKTEGGVKTKPRLLGPRCRRLANGTSASDPSLVHIPKKEGLSASSDSESDVFALQDKNVSPAVVLEHKPNTYEEVTMKPDGSQLENGYVNTEELHQNGMLSIEKLQEQKDTVKIKKLQQRSSYVNIEKLEQQYIEELQRQNGNINIVELKQQDSNVNGDKQAEEPQSADKEEELLHSDKVMECNSMQVHDISMTSEKLEEKNAVELSCFELGELVARQRKRKKGLCRVSSAPCNLKAGTGKEAESAAEGLAEHPSEDLAHNLSTGSHKIIGRGPKSACKNQAARKRPASSLAYSMAMSDDCENSQEGNFEVHSPTAVDIDTDSRMAASESTSRTQSPIPKTDLPFTISEHSQDADCSSLPQSNPNSTSSSPAFPHMAMTCTDNKDKQEPCSTQTHVNGQLNTESGRGEGLTSTPFCFQTMCDKVREVRSCHRPVDASSESSDSQEVHAQRTEENSLQSLSFSWEDKLRSEDSALMADMDKDKLKKQKKLTPNQRLGVAFLSKRRRKGKVKGSSVKNETSAGTSKVMDSLSLLHMATLASLEAEVGGKEDLKYPCTPWRIGSSKAEEKENHNVGMLQHLADSSMPWKTFSFSTERKEGECDTNVGVKSALDPERSPDTSDGQTVEKKTKTLEEPSTLLQQDAVHPIANKPADRCQENKGGDNSGDETDDYQISESTQNLREEKTHNKSHVKRKEISSENSDEEESRESESRSDNKAKDDSSGVRKRSCKMKVPLYEESDEKTDDYTVKVSGTQSANRQMGGYRKRKVKRKTRGHKPENNKNKLLDSLDALHMATLASLGTDPPPPVHDDTMPRYSDSVWDHIDDFEESLIKMSYTSPVHSDLADLSPPLPLSPEDLSRVNLSQIQKQRTMPCRLKVDESRGTRIVCMAQVRAENAAERSSRLFKPIASPIQQESRHMNSAARGVVQDLKSPGLKSPSVVYRLASKSATQPGYTKSPNPPLTPVERGAGFQSHSTSCQTAQPTILNPQKLPTPTIPWHHPLHVITAWQECTLPDAAKDQYNSRKGSAGDSAVHASPHHSSDSVHHKDRDSSLSRGCDTLQPAAFLRTPPFSSALQRENRGILPSSSAPMNHVAEETSPRTLQSHVSNLRRPSASYGPLGEIHNHGSRRLPFTSLAQMYAQRDRDCERSPSVSGEVSAVCDQDGGKSSAYQQLGMGRLSNTHPRRSEFHGDSYIMSPHSSNQPSEGPLSWSSQSMSSRRKSEEIFHGNTKSSPVAAFSHRDMHTLVPQPSPSGVRFQWSRSVDSGENREMRGQRVGEMRNQREGEVRSWREGEVRNQSDGQARSHRWGEARNQREVEIRSPREESVIAEKRTPTSCGLPMSTPTKWLSDISNTSTAGKPSPPSQQNTPVPHYSPRLSRTEMVISQMFNLESGSNTVSSSQITGQEAAHSVPGDRWQNNKPGMVSSVWRSLHDVEREPSADRLQQPPTTPLVKTPPAASWEKPAFSISTSSEHQLSPSQKSATPCLSSRLGYGENLPMGYSHSAQKSPVTSVYDRQVTSAVIENSPPGLMRMEKAAAGESPSSVFSETSPMAMKSQPANWYQPKSSPLQFHDIRQDKSRSQSAYDSVHCLPESAQSYSGTVSTKWPEYSSQNHSSFMLNLSGLSEREKGDANTKSALSSGAEKNLYRSASWSSNVANTHVSEVNMAEPYNRSPGVSSPSAPVSTVTSSSKSPGKGSPHSKLSENTQFSKPEVWQQRNRKRSIGEYLEEMIESAYAKESPEKPPCSWSEVRQENCAYPIRSEEGSSTHTVAVNGLISSALDLTKCSGKDENTRPYVSSSLSVQTPCVTSVTGVCSSSALDMPSGYSKGTFSSMASSSYHISKPSLITDTTTGMSHPSSVLPVSSSVTSHPTWTTIKTDDFENITDDEDEEVIPSSQGYTTGAYRFPGFRRLSSISSSWTPYSLHNATVSKMPSQTCKDVSGGGSVAETMTPSHSYSSSNMYSYTKGGYSQCNGVSQSSKPIYGFGQTVDSYAGPSRESLSQQLERSEYGIVTSIGTPWKESQTPASVPTSTHMSQFEPITDSEDEEEGSAGVTHDSNMRTSQYSTSVPSSALSGTSFFPNHSVIMSSSAYSSVRSSALGLMSSSAYSSLQSKALSSSSLLTRLDSGNSSASTGELKRSFVETKSYSTDQPLLPSEGVASGMDSALTTVDNKMHVSVFGDGGDRHDDSEPEDGGGRKRGKKTNLSPSDRSSSAHQGPGREKGEKQKDSDKESGWQRNPKETTAGQLQTGGSSGLVLCPKAPPPSREAVKSSAVSVGLSVEPVLPAFCSHPPDLPDMPRELGGRVLRLPTNMVKELEELSPPGEGQGLGAWQSLKMAESPLLSSQQQQPTSSSSSSLSLRLRTEPQLRFVLADDSPCVITPVRLPPPCSRVTAWLQDTLQKLPSHRCKTELKMTGTDRGREEAWGMEEEEGDASLPLDIDVPVEEEEDEALRRDSDDDDEEDSMFTRLRNTSREPGQGTSKKVAHGADDKDSDASHGSSTPKRQRLDPEAVLHSTPVRRSSSDLFDVTCTPINDGKRGESCRGDGETAEAKFATPKHPPLRRLSTSTQAALTRAVMTADQKQRSFEGEMSQIDAPTPKNTHGFKVTQQNLQDAKALHKHQFLTVLSMELHVDSRGDLMPDPEVDDIRVVFYAVFDDIPSERGRRNMTGAIVVDKESCKAQKAGHRSQPSTSTGGGVGGKRQLFEKCAILEELDVVYVESERELLQHFAQLIVRLDPDILLGFEVQQMSWGFLLQRAAQLSVNLCSQISRIHGSKQGNRFSAEKDEWGADHTSEIHIEGRIVLNLWRLLRHEVTLNIYSFENCAFHILHRRVPAYTYRSLTSWYNHRTRLHAWRVVDYYVQRVRGQLAMLDQLDLIGKTSEFARVFGIEFYDVLSRGSQYRVESMMLRLAKPLNFIPVSPSVQQRARQKAAECIPLTLEPQSRMYTDPVVVLDFQSLYPSIMIAYNYCFSTCLGRLQHLAHASEGPFEFGCTALSVPPESLKKIRKHVTISPNGCVFVTGKVRRGVLPMMVEEILQTRLMVKKSMKDYKEDKTLHRMLDARQLGLKLIANVTYGYTGASFSGRMPCIEVGDSIVRKARESLERAIQLVEDTPHWRAEVVYGDTDSLFIRLPGRSKDEAFVLGQEIADTVTNMFPKPMKLKFEKVYLPCALQTKKRYVGFMYETRDQQEAVFDAKGIETVRRDNCGVVSKVLERCIKILFTQRDVSQVRAYLHRQLTKMLAGRVGLQDFVFAKEYRGMMGYKPGACVPSLEIAKKRLQGDRRAEPRVGERVPYVIVHGSPGLPLIQLVRQPRELLSDPSLRINVTYYISKQVLPPLDRLLSLVGVSVFQWYNDMPKVVRLSPHVAPTAQQSKQGTISQYFVTSDCLVCERQTKEAVCASCRQDPQLVAFTLASRSAAYEALQNRLTKVCQTCMGVQDSAQPCVSLDCPVLFRRHLATLDLARTDLHRDALLKLTSF